MALESLCVPLALILGHLLHRDVLSGVRASLGSLGIGVLAAFPVLLLAALLARGKWRFAQPIVEVVDRLIIPFFRDWNLVEMALVAAIAGVGEELLFRGVLQSWAGEKWGTAAALVGASVLFGMVHWLNSAYALFAGLVGLYFGWLWIATSNLAVPIVAHGVYDFVALVYLTRLRVGRSDDAPRQAPPSLMDWS